MAIDANKKALLGVPFNAANGVTYTLLWTTNAACKAEVVAGLSMNSGLNTNTRAVLWGLLSSCHPEMDLDACGDMIDEESYRGKSEELLAAMNLAQEKASGKKKDPPQDPQKPALVA